MDKFCQCKEIKAVARDCKSTCIECGGIDAYKKSPLRPKNQEGTLAWAITQMKQGKKCTWIIGEVKPDEIFPVIGFDKKLTSSGFYDWNRDEASDIIISALLQGDTEWELCDEPKKTLSTYRGYDPVKEDYYILEQDVKQFIKDLKNEICQMGFIPYKDERIMNKINDLAGKELIK